MILYSIYFHTFAADFKKEVIFYPVY